MISLSRKQKERREMSITILDVALSRGVVEDSDGSVSASEFDRVGLPFFGGCQCCEASIAAYNMYPTTSGYVSCSDCLGDRGFETVGEFEESELPELGEEEVDRAPGKSLEHLTRAAREGINS
jgi:hypothetical protein